MALIDLGLLRLLAIDLIGGLRVREVLRTIHAHEYMPQVELDALRQARLQKLFTIARSSTGYYAAYQSFEDIPVTTKQAIRENPSAFLSSTYQEKLFKKATGGSTGVTLGYYASVQSQSYLWGALIHSWKVAGYQYGDRIAFIAGSSLIKSDFRHRVFYRFLNINAYDAFTLDEESIAHFLSDIQQKKTKLIFGYAMSVNLVAEYLLTIKPHSFPHLKGIICTSEVLTDVMRSNIEKAFGVKVYNQYGCNEAGVMAYECEDHHLHLISSRSIYEVDKEGHFTSTDLANDAFVFMKYDTGDIVEFSKEACSCGRTYPVISSVLGRSNDIITDMLNKSLHSNFFNNMFRKDASIRQFQVSFDKESITFNLSVDNSLHPQDYHHKYLDLIKKRITFKEYKFVLNAEFIKSGNAKHKYVVNNSR